jgi:tetratricopeptide (TPR) repeat protein
MRDYWKLVQNKNASSIDFKNSVFAFVKKYNFSFYVFEMDSFHPLEFTTSSLFGNTLLSDPRFKLIYFDDHTRVILDTNKDSRYPNKNVFTTITPFQLRLFPVGQEKEAVFEYQRMVFLSDSGMARLGLGEAYLGLGNLDKSEESFIRATYLNPYLGRAFLGLGKVDLQRGKKDKAILNFKKAITISPYLGEGYLLLGETYYEIGKKDLAISTLEKGLQENIDLISRREIVSTIEKNR